MVEFHARLFQVHEVTDDLAHVLFEVLAVTLTLPAS